MDFNKHRYVYLIFYPNYIISWLSRHRTGEIKWTRVRNGTGMNKKRDRTDRFSLPVGRRRFRLRPMRFVFVVRRPVNWFRDDPLDVNGLLDVLHILHRRWQVDVMHFRCAVVTGFVTESAEIREYPPPYRVKAYEAHNSIRYRIFQRRDNSTYRSEENKKTKWSRRRETNFISFR